MTLDIYTDRYEHSHGVKPRGKGYWAFDLVNFVTREERVIFVPGSMTLSDAKVWVKAHVREEYPDDYNSGHVELYVAP